MRLTSRRFATSTSVRNIINYFILIYSLQAVRYKPAQKTKIEVFFFCVVSKSTSKLVIIVDEKAGK